MKTVIKKNSYLVIVTLFVLPVLFSTLYKDDMVHSLRYYNQSGDLSIALKAVRDDISGLLNAGRFNPVLSFLGVFIFHFINHDSFFSYKIIQFILLGGTVIFFLRYLEKKTDYRTALLMGLMLLSQTAMDPNYHDPYLSYNFLMPVVTLLLFYSFYLYHAYLENSSVTKLVMSMLLYTIALLTYELSYPFLLVFIILTAYDSPKNIKAWGSLTLVATLMVFLQVGLRSSVSEVGYSGVSFSFELLPIIRTFMHQAFSAVPLSRIWGRIGRFVFTRTEGFYLREIVYCIVLVALTGHFVIKCAKLVRKKNEIELLSVIGMLIWLLPAVPIALSLKYQNELSLMRGYLPRYIQNFGFCLYVLPYIVKIPQKHYTTAMAVFLVFALSTFGYNIERIRHANHKYYASRILFYFVKNEEFLKENGVEKIHILKNYAYWPESYLPVNPHLTLTEDQNKEQGDCFLLISEGSKKEAYAYWGRFGFLLEIEELYKAEYNIHSKKSDYQIIKDWQLVPLENEKSYEELIESLRI